MTNDTKHTTAAYEDQAIKEEASVAKKLFPKGAKPLFARGGDGSSMSKSLMIGLIIVALLILPVVLQGLGQKLLISSLVLVGLYIILALGLNIVVGYAGLLDFGRIAFYAFGAYTAMIISMPLARFMTNTLGVGWDQLTFPVIVIAAGVIAALVGWLLSLPVMRLRGDYLAIVTLGFGEIVRICIEGNIFGITNGANGLPRVGETLPKPPLFEFLSKNVFFDFGKNFYFTFDRGVYWFYMVLLFILLAIIVVRRQDNSRLGRSWAALREDEVAATAMGVNTTRVKTWALVLGAVWGGVAGACFAYYQGGAVPTSFIFFNSVMVLAIVVIGGMGSTPGVIVGGLIIQGFPELIRWFATTFSIEGIDATTVQNYRNLLLGLLMVVMMVVRTEGLVPSKRLKRELRGAGGPDGSTIVEGDVLINETPAGGGGIA